MVPSLNGPRLPDWAGPQQKAGVCGQKGVVEAGYLHVTMITDSAAIGGSTPLGLDIDVNRTTVHQIWGRTGRADCLAFRRGEAFDTILDFDSDLDRLELGMGTSRCCRPLCKRLT